MTKATRETTKLNFITDQGSTRAMVRCACRAVRFDCAFCVFCFCVPLRTVTGLEAAAAAAPDRRNARAGDDGEWGGGSGISHANAAGETEGASAGDELAGRGRPDGMVPEDAAGDGPLDGFAAGSAGSATVWSPVADQTEADGSGPKLNAGESSAGAGSLAWPEG